MKTLDFNGCLVAVRDEQDLVAALEGTRLRIVGWGWRYGTRTLTLERRHSITWREPIMITGGSISQCVDQALALVEREKAAQPKLKVVK